MIKNIKQHKQSSLSRDLLDDLLTINVNNVKVEDFNADIIRSIELSVLTQTCGHF